MKHPDRPALSTAAPFHLAMTALVLLAGTARATPLPISLPPAPAKTPSKPGAGSPPSPAPARPGTVAPATPPPPTAPAPGAATPGAQPPAPGAGQPPAAPAAVPGPTDAGAQPEAVEPLGPGDTFRFGPFSDPVQLSQFVISVRDQLGLPIISFDTGLQDKTVVLPAPIELPAEHVIPFLVLLLEQNGYTLVESVPGVYVAQRLEDVQPNVGADRLATTRVIRTPGIQPSSLAPSLLTLGIQQGVAAPGTRVAAASFLDDIGIMIVTGTPRQVGLAEDLVRAVSAERANLLPQRFDLMHVAAGFARDRILELAGELAPAPRQTGAATQRPGAAGQPNQPAPQVAVGMLSNLAQRLTVDPQGNALFFRGRIDETSALRELILIVDRPNTLLTRAYRASDAVAMEGQRLGLGAVGYADGQSAPSFGAAGTTRGGQATATNQPAAAIDASAGPGFTVFPESGMFMYRGTPEQHERVERLVVELADLTASELIVVELYKLKHSKATEVAEIMRNLLSNQVPTGTGPLLQRGLGRGGFDRRLGQTQFDRSQQAPVPQTPEQEARRQAEAGSSLAAIEADENTFVLADEQNNQVIVKALKRVQPQFERLIHKLDLRRPQVYIDAKIVAITGNEDFRLRFEQQILAGEFAYATSFGITPPLTNIQDKRTVPSAAGLVTAMIKSDQVPIVLHALQTNSDSRILSTPQLLVDDNEQAEVSSFNEVPFAATTQNANTTTTAQGGTAEAGTLLTVTPQISEGGYLKLDYAIELSSFTGAASNGLQPPTQRNNISSASVTVPSDATIVVGGLTFEATQDTVIKVPLLGDIPLLGLLFRDTAKATQQTTLYVFITPKIMRDPSFAD
ncbi:MAG TPA: secretin N-terminal domain-containing protein, partial [Phycisphaerales bacterium]|nr:secretin N-terminal domain-containing protein [Phycisphaerales bacterium]